MSRVTFSVSVPGLPTFTVRPRFYADGVEPAGEWVVSTGDDTDDMYRVFPSRGEGFAWISSIGRTCDDLVDLSDSPGKIGSPQPNPTQQPIGVSK